MFVILITNRDFTIKHFSIFFCNKNCFEPILVFDIVFFYFHHNNFIVSAKFYNNCLTIVLFILETIFWY